MMIKIPPSDPGNDYYRNQKPLTQEDIVYALRQIADADKCNFSTDGVALAVRLARDLLMRMGEGL